MYPIAYSNSTLLWEVTVVNAVDNGDGGNLHARRAKIALAGPIAGWGDEAMDFEAQPQASDRSLCWVVLVMSV